MQISIPGTGIAGLGRDHPEQWRGRALVHGPGDCDSLPPPRGNKP